MKLLFLLVISAASAASASGLDPRFDVRVDPRVELETVVELLAGPPHDTNGLDLREDAAYLKGAAARFARFKDHPGVKTHAARRTPEFNAIVRSQLLLCLTDPPEFAERLPVSSWRVDQGGGPAAFAAWVAGLGAFARDSDFMGWFAKTAPSYEPVLAPLRAELARTDYLRKLDAYTGLPFEGSYSVFLSPGRSGTGVGNTVEFAPDGTAFIGSLLGLRDDAGFAPSFLDTELPAILWHESAHGVLDVLGDLHREEIDRSSAAYAALGVDCYGEWHQCVKEHAVRAVMVRLVTLERGETEGARRLEQEATQKFPYLKALTAKLKDEYETDRKKWPNIAAYYPELLKVLPARHTDGGQASAQPMPGYDALSDGSRGFMTRGQRRRAVKVLAAAGLPGPRALFEYLLEDYQAAEADATRALAADGSDARSLLVRALARRSAGAATDAAARKDYDRAVSLCRTGEAAGAVCGDARLNERRFDDWFAPAADETARSSGTVAAVAFDAPAPEGADADFFRARALARFGKGDAAGAVADFDSALKLAPGDPVALMDRGVALHASKRLDEALASYAQALTAADAAKAPGFASLKANVLSCRASLHLERGDWEKAGADLELALKTAPPSWGRRVETEQQLARVKGWKSRQPGGKQL